MPEKSMIQTVTKAQVQLPVSTGARTATVGDLKLEILIYEGWKGPNFEQAEYIARSMGKRLLTDDEALKIKGALEQGEWGHIHYQKSKGHFVPGEVLLSGPGWRRGAGVFEVSEDCSNEPALILIMTEAKTKIRPPVETNTQTLIVKGQQTFTIDGQAYTMLRYAKNKGPTFAQSIEVAKNMGKDMPSFNEIREICDKCNNQELDIASRNALNSAGMAFVIGGEVRTAISEEPLVACFVGWGKWSSTYNKHADEVADSLILKETSSEAAVIQAKGLLRSTK